MIDITNFRNGQILHHRHGVETGDALAVRIEGLSLAGSVVKVNGERADMDGRRFCAPVRLTKKRNPVTVSTATPFGTFSQEITLVWDKTSFPRCNFYIDDHIFLFTDLAAQRPARAFDHFYLAGLRKIHDRWGLKVTLNCFYRNDHHAFELKDMPDAWKGEFADNADWLRLSFHAHSEFPDRPYLEANAEEFGRDYDRVKGEILRFAGEQAWIPPVVIHWANIHPAVARELMARGSTCYSRAFRARVMGGPSLAERRQGGDMGDIEKRTAVERGGNMDGFRAHYEAVEEQSFLGRHRAFYDTGMGVFFFSGSCCCNLLPCEGIRQAYREAFADSTVTGNEIFGGASHEQYSFPYYPNHVPDHMERIETAIRCMVEGGCTPVHFAEGLLGNPAWDEKGNS